MHSFADRTDHQRDDQAGGPAEREVTGEIRRIGDQRRICLIDECHVRGRGAGSDGGTDGGSERISPAQTTPLEIAAPLAKACGAIEIEVSGARIRVEPGVELATLSTVLAALRGCR